MPSSIVDATQTAPSPPAASVYLHEVEVSGSSCAAATIAPIVCELIGTPGMAVDLGGGTGAWCAAFKACGVHRVHCIDHPSARAGRMLIDDGEFQSADLGHDNVAPVGADLAICVELAEHLPASRADWIVEFLTKSAPVVLFSAAVPRQGGVHHVNEQFRWYWSERFASRGFEERDCIRHRILGDESIPFWYRQNLILYADPARVPPFPGLPLLPPGFELLHRTVLERLREPPTLRTIVREFFPSIGRAIRYRMQRDR